MKNSARKGKDGELEAAHKLAELLGCEARRGRQYSGSDESPDLITSVPGVHFEVKRVEALRLWEAIEQAVKDAAQNVPVVLHRASRRPWLAIVRLDDLPKLAVQIYLTLSANK